MGLLSKLTKYLVKNNQFPVKAKKQFFEQRREHKTVIDVYDKKG